MILRAAKATDAERICEIWNHYIETSTVTFTTDLKSPTQICETIAARQGCGKGFFVVEDANQVQGFALCSEFRSGPGYRFVWEHSVMLAPGCEGRGFGRALMAHLERHACVQGATALVAGISGSNTDAIAFHAALGFEKAGLLRGVGFKFDRWLDLVLMQKELSPTRSN